MNKLGNNFWVAGLLCCFVPALASAQSRVQIGLSGLDNEVKVSSAGTPIGQFLLAEQTKIARADGTFLVDKSEAIRVSDTVVNAGTGRSQWAASDDALFAVGPESALRVNQYTMPKGGNPGVIDLTLVRGGFRSIAGALGQGGNQYRVKTQAAQLDVKGADFWAIQCANDCYTSDHKKLPDGLFVGVNSGTVKIVNSFGSLDLGPGQFARVASPAAMLAALPPVYAGFSASFVFALGIAQLFEPLRIEAYINLSLGSPSSPSTP